LATLSPCVGLCQIESTSGLCSGCARSGEEIASWKDAPEAVLNRIWAELPGRREKLGIGLHRLGWSPEVILSFVQGTLRAGQGSWVVGAFGAVAKFSIGRDDVCEVERDGSRITARTGRGAVRFEITERVRVLSTRVNVGGTSEEIIILAVPRSRTRPRPNAGLTALGVDRDAIRPADRGDRLYDLGLDSEAAAFCVRTRALDLVEELDRGTGRKWADLPPEEGDWIIYNSPSRVALNDLARIEVFAPIPPPDGQALVGPHAHFPPTLLAFGQETPPRWDVPESFVPCAIFYPIDLGSRGEYV